MADTQVTICDFCCRSRVTSSGNTVAAKLWLFCKHSFACYSFQRAFGDLMLEYYISYYIFLIVCSISYNLLSRCSYFVLIDTKTLGCNITEIIWVIFDKDHFNSSLFCVYNLTPESIDCIFVKLRYWRPVLTLDYWFYITVEALIRLNAKSKIYSKII